MMFFLPRWTSTGRYDFNERIMFRIRGGNTGRLGTMLQETHATVRRGDNSRQFQNFKPVGQAPVACANPFGR